MTWEIRRTRLFATWIDALDDRRAAARILLRIERLAAGNAGDVRPVGRGVSELRIDHGPGYRVYFTRSGRTVFLLLCGGDKSTQESDIRAAIAMAQAARE